MLLVALMALGMPAVAAPPFNAVKIAQEAEGPVIEFTDGDYVPTVDGAVPTQGWERKKTPNIYRQVDTRWRTGDVHGLWARHRFDRASLGKAPLALYTVSTRNQFTIYLNGAEIFRNFAAESDNKLAWYRPFLAPIPKTALRPGMNEILIRATSRDTLGVGRVVIGPHGAVEANYKSQFFWRISAPMVASSAMLILGGFGFLLWLGRRQEIELLYLSISTTIWFLRNYQYFAEDTPFDLATFNALSVSATLIASVFTFAFYATYMKIRHHQAIIGVMIAVLIPYCFIHWYFQLSNFLLYVPTVTITLSMAIIGYLNFYRTRLPADIVWPSFAALMAAFGTYDAMLAGSGAVWKGNDFYLALFNGFFYCLAFLLTFGTRALRAFTDLGEANTTLERRIFETRIELAESEAARQTLVVGSAIAGERERLMQEMHDGIGSNLITALAVARQQNQPASTIKTLSRALGDLKITVDSLEPIEGDLVALIGNLRHRMAGDLRDAGITCKWEAQPCGSLPWLDATNALHVLRIFQEAIGNVLTHANASEIRIGCAEVNRGGTAGISAYVADNGGGFESSHLDTPGKGLANIRARASSLHGALDCVTNVGTGTKVTLWLPYSRAG
jgi:signal transduction histidine kinase